MIKKYYNDIDVYTFQEGYFSTAPGYVFNRTIKGLIQNPSNVKTFNNGKDTSSISGVLFCDIKEVFDEKDIIEFNGIRFKIAGAGSQPIGVSGITPHKGQHAEYNLVYTQEGI